ncbi:hypothetical protein AB1Y20_018232 [Prymnesium parvum]|uniref:BAG domain-containing protein n=1 Tax=Prymnesium parvum TaxID=97485 RepID=A0AB34JR84_PRYPA
MGNASVKEGAANAAMKQSAPKPGWEAGLCNVPKMLACCGDVRPDPNVQKRKPENGLPQQGGFYNVQQYYYLRSQPPPPPEGVDVAASRPPPTGAPSVGVDAAAPQPPHAAASVPQAKPNIAPAPKPSSDGTMASIPKSNGRAETTPASPTEEQSLYLAMVVAATVEVKSNMSVDHLKEHVRDVMMKMTEARSAGMGSPPSEEQKQKIQREVADALSAKVEMAVATATGHSVEPDASLQVLHDLETRMQRTLNGPHAHERMPEAVELREGLARIRGMIAVREG